MHTYTEMGSATSRLWNFGDGAFSTVANPQHTYVATGSFTVTLTVTGTMGTNSRYKPAYITVREKQFVSVPLGVRSH